MCAAVWALSEGEQLHGPADHGEQVGALLIMGWAFRIAFTWRKAPLWCGFVLQRCGRCQKGAAAWAGDHGERVGTELIMGWASRIAFTWLRVPLWCMLQRYGALPEGQQAHGPADHEEAPPEDEELRRAAVERDVRESQRSFKHVFMTDKAPEGHVVVDTRRLGRKTKASKEARQLLVDKALATKDQDNERFTRKLRARFERQDPRPPPPPSPFQHYPQRYPFEIS